MFNFNSFRQEIQLVVTYMGDVIAHLKNNQIPMPYKPCVSHFGEEVKEAVITVKLVREGKMNASEAIDSLEKGLKALDELGWELRDWD